MKYKDRPNPTHKISPKNSTQPNPWMDPTHVHVWCYGSVCVCPSVTSRCSIETAELVELVFDTEIVLHTLCYSNSELKQFVCFFSSQVWSVYIDGREIITRSATCRAERWRTPWQLALPGSSAVHTLISVCDTPLYW